VSPPGNDGGPGAEAPRPTTTTPATTTNINFDLNGVGYAGAFDDYHRLGWLSVLPVPRGAKYPPPKGYTGHDGAVPSYADMMTWAEQFPDGNAALRLSDDILGIDVDAYGDKTGAATIAEAERLWGKLPVTYRSTSRDDGVSGIRFFRVPSGTQLRDGISFTEMNLGGIDIVQHVHRYAMVPPSIHPNGSKYRWIAEIDMGVLDQPPAAGDLPDLPDVWIENLKIQPVRSGAGSGPDGAYDVDLALTEGNSSPAVLLRLCDAVIALADGTSRHDTTCAHALALLRLGKDGESGVKTALTVLMHAFTATVTADGSRTQGDAVAEFQRMIRGPRAAVLLAEPSYVDVVLDEFDEAGNVVTGDGRVEPTSAVQVVPDAPPVKVTHSAHLGFAIKLGEQFEDKLLYINKIGWHRWDSKRWTPDGNGAARRAVHTVIARERAKADKLPIEDREKRARQLARYETASAITGVLTEAAVLHVFSVEVSDLDADPWLFNCANGTLDLRTMNCRAHDPADRITKVANAAYRPDAAGTAWPTFLGRVLPDADVRGYLQRLTGLSLLGEVNGDKQIAPIMTGGGANGKTTCTEAITFAMGDYAMAAEPTLLMAKRGDAHPTGVADLVGRRFVSVCETEKGRRFDIALLKWLTGGDTLKARLMRQDFFSFQPSYLLMMATNHLPEIDDDTEAVWRRIRVIPFAVEIPKTERDEQLKERLRVEADAVLGWIIAGWTDYRQRGGLAEPAAVLAETDKYKADSDVIGRFIADECHVGGAQTAATTSTLHSRWETWAAKDGALPLTRKAFGQALTVKGYPPDPAGDRLRRGIGLKAYGEVAG
jgi:putative DNA primase/helicase